MYLAAGQQFQPWIYFSPFYDTCNVIPVCGPVIPLSQAAIQAEKTAGAIGKTYEESPGS